MRRAQGLLGALGRHVCRQTAPAPAPPPLPLQHPRLPALLASSAVLSELAARAHGLRHQPALRCLARFALDVSLGCLFAFLLLRHAEAAAAAVRYVGATLTQSQLLRLSTWLGGAQPWGLKLHRPLSEALAEGGAQFARLCATLGAAASPLTPPALARLAWAGPLLGASMQAALLCDALSLLFLPLTALDALCAAWLRVHAAGIRNLYLKLYRPQHQPVSGRGAYRLERLTVGALLLTPLLALAPTLAAFGACARALAAPPRAARAALRGMPGAGGRVVKAASALWRGGGRGEEVWMEVVSSNVYRMRP